MSKQPEKETETSKKAAPENCNYTEALGTATRRVNAEVAETMGANTPEKDLKVEVTSTLSSKVTKNKKVNSESVSVQVAARVTASTTDAEEDCPCTACSVSGDCAKRCGAPQTCTK